MKARTLALASLGVAVVAWVGWAVTLGRFAVDDRSACLGASDLRRPWWAFIAQGFLLLLSGVSFLGVGAAWAEVALRLVAAQTVVVLREADSWTDPGASFCGGGFGAPTALSRAVAAALALSAACNLVYLALGGAGSRASSGEPAAGSGGEYGEAWEYRPGMSPYLAA